jgi:hypothetical protein
MTIDRQPATREFFGGPEESGVLSPLQSCTKGINSAPDGRVRFDLPDQRLTPMVRYDAGTTNPKRLNRLGDVDPCDP